MEEYPRKFYVRPFDDFTRWMMGYTTVEEHAMGVAWEDAWRYVHAF